MEKSRDAFRTISEVAEWLGTPTHVLRFWESRFSQVKPVKRAGGRRYYRPADMALLGGIKKLLHDDGLTIRGVQKILREEGVKHVSTLSPAVEDNEVADMATDVEVLAETDNVVQMTPQAEPTPDAVDDAPKADVIKPDADVAEGASDEQLSPDTKPAPAPPQAPESGAASRESLAPEPGDPEPAADDPAEDPSEITEPTVPEAAPETAEPAAASEADPAAEPDAATPPRRSGIFASPPLSKTPDPVLQPDPEPAQDAAPETPGPDQAALQAIYDRLMGLRDRMGSDDARSG